MVFTLRVSVQLCSAILMCAGGCSDSKIVHEVNRIKDLAQDVPFMLNGQELKKPRANAEYALLYSQLHQNPHSDLPVHVNSNGLLVDTWGHAYIFLHDGDGRLVLIGSCGKDGIWQGGMGDDLSEIITW